MSPSWWDAMTAFAMGIVIGAAIHMFGGTVFHVVLTMVVVVPVSLFLLARDKANVPTSHE